MNVFKFEQDVRDALDSGDTGKALIQIKHFVSNIVQDDAATGEVFGSKDLDALCLDIGKICAKDMNFCDKVIASDINSILIIASHIEVYGGHSKVCIDLISKGIKFNKFNLIVTDVHGVFNDNDLGIECPIFVAPNFGDAEKLKWLINKISEINPRKIILFNHHQDSVAVASVQPFLDTRQVIYYHHADHNLALGVHLPNVDHIDPTNIGYFSCREHEGLEDNLYFPLTLADKGANRINSFLSNGLTTCSCGSYGPKFGIPYKYDYFTFVIRRLALRDGVHYHVGNIPKDNFENLMHLLDLNEINRGRFIHIDYTESLWDFLLEKSIDLYISSFPMAGARATMEAMGSATPILIHDSSYQRFFGGKDSAYPEVFLWRNQLDFENLISTIDEHELIKSSGFARNHFLKYHSHDYFLDYILDKSSSIPIKPPPLIPHTHDWLETYLYKKSTIESLANKKIQKLESKISVLSYEIELNKTINSTEKINSKNYLAGINRIYEKIEYLRNRIFKAYSIYGSPLDKNSFSQGLVRAFSSKCFTFSPTIIKQFIRSQRRQLQVILQFEAKVNRSFVLLPSDVNSNRKLDLCDTDFKLLLIDHFGGGGSNAYSENIIKNELESHSSVLKVGFYEGYWFACEIFSRDIPAKVYMLGSTSSLLSFLEKFKLREVVINSVYGVPNLPDFILNLKDLFRKNPLIISSYVLHDFLPICPSLHLLNCVNQYCGVPQERDCNLCYKSLDIARWSHSWIEIEKLPNDVKDWRQPFRDLFNLVDQIVCFSNSSEEILRRAFGHIENVKIIPVFLSIHKTLRKVKVNRESINIGCIGDMNIIKGAERINGLADYIAFISAPVPITILGQSSAMAKNVRRHGRYKLEELANLIEEIGINVIFFSSVVPETYSYVLSEIFELGLPVVAYDIGAQSERVRNYPLGIVIPLNSHASILYKAIETAHGLNA